jgi:WD40 repeat protein
MTTLATATLPLHADCAAFAPAVPGLLAAAGYQLDEATRTRAGGVWLYECGGGRLRGVGGVTGGAGVFDAAWAPASWGGGAAAAAAPATLALALADGRVETRRLEEEEEGAGRWGLPLVAAGEPGGGDGAAAASPPAMALYLAHHPAVPGRTAVTLADGRVALMEGERPAPAARWRAHSLEAWSAAWCGACPHLLYTGGDDGVLAAWDVREAGAGGGGGDPSTPAWRAPRGAHGAGVTALAPSTHAAPHVLATGSYDESVRLWDVRWPAAPLATAAVGAGGGVWRLAWRDPASPSLLLAACMHASFALVGVGADVEGGGGVGVVERYTAHGGDDLGYGAAWWVGGGGGAPTWSPPPPFTTTACTCGGRRRREGWSREGQEKKKC